MDTPGNMDIYLRYCQGRVAKLRLTVIVNTHIHTFKKKKKKKAGFKIQAEKDLIF